MDKLAMEEAGFRNCVSVPDGAPSSVSTKELPSEEKVSVHVWLFSVPLMLPFEFLHLIAF